MDDQRLGSVLRAIRIRRQVTQRELAGQAGVSSTTVSRLERGHIAPSSIATLRKVASVLDVRLELTPAWRGADLDRLMNAGHAAMHEAVIEMFESLPRWELASEVSFSIYGERGVLDVLAFHAASRTALVIELKTEIIDGQGLVGTMDRRRRLAIQIAAERGWDARTVGVWVLVDDSRSNRRRLARQQRLLRLAFPTDGRAMRAWLREPRGSVAALSFLPKGHFMTNNRGRNVGHAFGLPKRVASSRHVQPEG
jgi:transcriptional regulator with XRE-family HTH domain